MVASSPPEPSSQDYAALIQRLDAMQRQIDESGRASRFPFVVSHGGVTDFQVVPSPTLDGTADIFMGDGAGNPAFRTRSVPGSAFKIVELFDASAGLMYSVDSITGYGLGNPVLPYPFGGYESLTLNGATTPGTATDIGYGSNWAYNPCTVVQPRIRFLSSTAVTVNLFAAWTGGVTTYTTTERVINLSAGVPSINFPSFAVNWAAGDMRTASAVTIRAYCSAGIAANANVTLAYRYGAGVSRGYSDSFLQGAL
jgi:hypothetical protein